MEILIHNRGQKWRKAPLPHGIVNCLPPACKTGAPGFSGTPGVLHKIRQHSDFFWSPAFWRKK